MKDELEIETENLPEFLNEENQIIHPEIIHDISTEKCEIELENNLEEENYNLNISNESFEYEKNSEKKNIFPLTVKIEEKNSNNFILEKSEKKFIDQDQEDLEYDIIHKLPTTKINSTFPLPLNDENLSLADEETEIIKNSHKKSLRQNLKNKLLLKNTDIQHELDIYNSNFEVTKKYSKITKLSNKIEFIENTEDYNKKISIELDQQEDRLISLFNQQKDSDFKTSFLYLNKAHKVYKNKTDYLEYLDLMDYVVFCKDENKKKKNSQINPNIGNLVGKDNKIQRKNSVGESDVSQFEEFEKTDRKKVNKIKGRPKLNKITTNGINSGNEINNNFETSLNFYNKNPPENMRSNFKNSNILLGKFFFVRKFFIFYFS